MIFHIFFSVIRRWRTLAHHAQRRKSVGFLYKFAWRYGSELFERLLYHWIRDSSAGVGTAFAFNTLPKRSVAAIGNENGQIQDLDARRKITIKIIRSESNNNKKDSVSGYRICSYLFWKKEKSSPTVNTVGLFSCAALCPFGWVRIGSDHTKGRTHEHTNYFRRADAFSRNNTH